MIHRDRFKQLWVIIKRVDDYSIWELEYLMNFGVTLDQQIAIKRALNDTSVTGESDETNWFTHHCKGIPLH